MSVSVFSSIPSIEEEASLSKSIYKFEISFNNIHMKISKIL